MHDICTSTHVTGRAPRADPITEFTRWHTFADVPPSVFNRGVAVDVGQQPEAESFGVVGRVRVAVDDHRRRRRVENLADAIVEFVIRDRRPVSLLLISHRLDVYSQHQ